MFKTALQFVARPTFVALSSKLLIFVFLYIGVLHKCV